MTKIFSFAVVSISLFIYTYAFANQCPSVNSIRALGLNHIEDVIDWNKKVSYEPYSTYDTDQKWNFHITYGCPIFGKCDDEKILSAARKSLDTLRFKESTSTTCIYTSHDNSIGYIAANLVS